MSKDKRLFARLDLDYADHPKIAGLSDAAFRAHIELILYARKYETDGLIGNRHVNRVGSRWDTDVVSELLSNDTESPSLVRLESGHYMLHGFSDMQETKAEITARKRKNARNGLLGGRPNKTQWVSDSVPHSVPHSGTQSKAETETETETELCDFELFWDNYPKKTDKVKAQLKFKSKVRKSNFNLVMAGVKKYKDEIKLKNTGKQYIKHAKSWLEGECWNNEYEAEAKKPIYRGL